MKRAVLLLLTLAVGGCTLLPRSRPADVHYYTPEAPARAAAPRSSDASVGPLRFGRITSSPYLRSRIAFRESAYEVGSYAERRWTEEPDAYLRRALARRLFEEGSVTQVVVGPAAVLDVDLVTFEEVRRGDARLGRVELDYALHRDGAVLASGRIQAERPASSPEMRAVVAAIAAALDAATAAVADAIVPRLR